MSLQIIPYPTASAIERALEAHEGGFSLKIKYIWVGQGRQTIELDDAGRAITEVLAEPIGYVEVLNAKKINGYQWQITVDISKVVDHEWHLSEFAACDENKNVIAIYGNEDQALLSITPFLDNALLAMNLVLATFPANSVVIEHHNLPLELFFDNEFKMLHLAYTDVANSQLKLVEELDSKASASEFGLVAANQSMALQLQNQANMQAGVLAARQYNYHGDTDVQRNVWDRNYNPAGSHNHSNYDRMSGNAEVSCITPTGQFIRVRHSDYRHKQAIQGGFLAREDVPMPCVPASVTQAGDLQAQINAMRHLYARYAAGEFPEGFKFVGVAIECWVEPFEGDITETFDSFRHQQNLDSAIDQFHLNKTYFDTGLKDRFENLPFNQVFVANIDKKGRPKLAVLKARFICRDLSELGDLRPWIETVDDPVMYEYRGINNERFKIRDEYNKPSKLDEIVSKFPGLDGAGAYIEETHQRYGKKTTVHKWGTSDVLNAAYYHRWGTTVELDASNRRNYLAGYNIPNFFKALTLQEKVMPTEFGNKQHRVSWLMPYELILYHPVMDWNPLNLTVNPKPAENNRNGNSSNNPYAGVNPNRYWYRTPSAFFSGEAVSERADTGSGVKWVLGPNNIAHPVRSSGIFITLPKIEGIGTVRQRYPIYQRPQDGSYETALSHAYHHRNIRMMDVLSAELTRMQKDSLDNLSIANKKAKAFKRHVDDGFQQLESTVNNNKADNLLLADAFNAEHANTHNDSINTQLVFNQKINDIKQALDALII